MNSNEIDIKQLAKAHGADISPDSELIIFHKQNDTIVKVLGWRTFRTKSKGGSVKWVQPCFWWFK